jgi:hypothetical protein
MPRLILHRRGKLALVGLALAVAAVAQLLAAR